MRPLRIVTTGLAVSYPLGGVFWDYLQYPLGFVRLGHEVLYVEDTGAWCYDPVAATFVADGSANAAHFARQVGALHDAMAARWFFRDSLGKGYGQDWRDVVRFCQSADLFLNISGSSLLLEEYGAAACVAFLDSDPLYTQSSVPAYPASSCTEAERQRIDTMRRHDVFFTFGEKIGTPECRVPDRLFDWIPTRQPVVLDLFDRRTPVGDRRPCFTTVASWEPTQRGPVVDGIEYFGKSVEFERFMDLPMHSPLPLEVAISGRPPTARLLASGWKLADPLAVSYDPWVYRDYLARSFGEWSVAKNAYVASRSGWLSCRTACYLALGVPAVIQDTGFGRLLPTGEGLLPFTTMEGAVEAIERIAREPDRHAAASRAIAEEYFDSDKVLTRLIRDAVAHAA